MIRMSDMSPHAWCCLPDLVTNMEIWVQVEYVCASVKAEGVAVGAQLSAQARTFHSRAFLVLRRGGTWMYDHLLVSFLDRVK